jgi:methionyl-tRNA formyltransferase
MSDGLRIIVAGSGRLGLAILIPLIESHHEVVGLIQNGRRVSPRERFTLPWQYRLLPSTPTPMAEALRSKIPILWLEKINDSELDSIRELKPDLIITCGFSIILPKTILELPAIGCINIHTAKLPVHKGANPCAHVILDGDKESGVTIHITEEGIDTGAILAQETFPVDIAATSMDVYTESCAVANEMILEAIEDIELDGFAKSTPQSPDTGSYDSRFDEEHCEIDWTQPAIEIDRLIRAAMAYGPAWFTHQGKQIFVVGSTYTADESRGTPGVILSIEPHIQIGTGQGTIELQYAYTKNRGGTQWPTLFTSLKPGTQLG